MATIKIDNKDYDVDSLSNDAKVQLQSIQFIDVELQRLQAQIAVHQTARATYFNALRQVLAASVTPPTVDGGGDTLKLG